MAETTPRWSLEQIYPGPESPAFTAGLKELSAAIREVEQLIDDVQSREGDPVAWLRLILPRYDHCSDLYENLESYAYASYSVDTTDTVSQHALTTVGKLSVPLAAMAVRFRDSLAELPGPVPDLLEGAPDLQGYRFLLEEERFFQKRQLPPEMESLAADLHRSGADAWSRLQETILSTLSVVWDPATGEKRSMVELRALAYNAERSVRRRAWELEIASWKGMEIPIAFALNGVKGSAGTLNTRRGWASTLERSVRQNRISLATLETLLTVMRRSLPLFHRYLRTKAALLGLEQLSFYDLFAPVGESGPQLSFQDAITFIQQNLKAFDPRIGEFVLAAQERNWIDAQPRSGKVGGAYCIDFPIAGASRILANFDNTYDGMSTLAHELGHAWHSQLLRDLPAGQRHYPMTLAETASIFNETLVFYRALERSEEKQVQLYILEQYLQGATQVIVDILSRFEFESAVMEQRPERELSPEEFCSLMTDAQRATYGEALNSEELHPFMWAVKGHYYRAELGFYNFPYAFGQLFGLGLYDQYEHSPTTFPERYRNLLMETGRASATEVAAGVGFDIESPVFWQGAVQRIEGLVTRFELLSR